MGQLPRLPGLDVAVSSISLHVGGKHYVRNWDYLAAQRVSYFIANSNYVAGRIRHYYGRDEIRDSSAYRRTSAEDSRPRLA